MNNLNSRPKRLPIWRFVAIILFTILADAVILFGEQFSLLMPGRWIFGLALSVLLPGYSMVGVLFPQKQLEPAESICIIPGLSLLILVLDGLAVNFLFGSLDLSLLVLVLSLEVIGLCIITVGKAIKSRSRVTLPYVAVSIG